MSSFTKEFADHVSVIVTNCLVFTPDDLSKGVPHAYYHTTNRIWDTGAEITVICPEIAEALGLKEIGTGQIGGIGGEDHEIWVAKVHLGLPSSETVENLKVYVDDIPDHDMIIGMDVMKEMDIAITNANGRTKFTYERPSTRNLDFSKNHNA